VNLGDIDLSKLDLTRLNLDEKLQVYELMRLKDIRAKRNRLATYLPYAKQEAFHEAGSGFRERLFMAGNQLGKTWAGADERLKELRARLDRLPIKSIAWAKGHDDMTSVVMMGRRMNSSGMFIVASRQIFGKLIAFSHSILEWLAI
jgi:hypothetical protein